MAAGDPLTNHRIDDLQGLYDTLSKRIDKMESRLWAFMATFAGSMVLAFIVAVRP